MGVPDGVGYPKSTEKRAPWTSPGSQPAHPALPPSQPSPALPPPPKSLSSEVIGSKKGRYFGSKNGRRGRAGPPEMSVSNTPFGPMPYRHELQGRLKRRPKRRFRHPFRTNSLPTRAPLPSQTTSETTFAAPLPDECPTYTSVLRVFISPFPLIAAC